FDDGNPGPDDYEYDQMGNLIRDRNKSIDSITYNHLNLPRKIYFSGGNEITYLYNADGVKLTKWVNDVRTDYMDGFQYVNGGLRFVMHAEGYFNITNTPTLFLGDYVYNFTDHLGNIRMSYAYDRKKEELKILEENHYYPFGL